MGVNPGRNLTQVAIVQGGAGSTDLVAAPGTGLRIYVARIVVMMAGAGTLKFTEGTGPTDLTGVIPIAANSGFVISGDVDNPVLWTASANAKLSIVTATAAAAGWIHYFLSAEKS